MMKDFHFRLQSVIFELCGGTKATGLRVVQVGVSGADLDGEEGSDLDAPGS